MARTSPKRSSIHLTALLVLVSILALGPARRAAAAEGYQIVTGQLELAAGGHYVLKCSQEQIPLKDAGGMDKHLGRTVRVTGQWLQDADGRRLRVAKIEYIAAVPVETVGDETQRASIPIVGSPLRPEPVGPDPEGPASASQATAVTTGSSGGS